MPIGFLVASLLMPFLSPSFDGLLVAVVGNKQRLENGVNRRYSHIRLKPDKCRYHPTGYLEFVNNFIT
jgi:hypothetical protein